MAASAFQGAMLIVLMLAFAGLWAWAWSKKRKDTFKQASMLPLEEDDGLIPGFNDEKE